MSRNKIPDFVEDRIFSHLQQGYFQRDTQRRCLYCILKRLDIPASKESSHSPPNRANILAAAGYTYPGNIYIHFFYAIISVFE